MQNEYQQENDLEGARDAFDRAIALKPDYAEAWNRRATLFFNDGKYDEAVADLESAITYEPRHFGALAGLGLNALAEGDYKSALAAYRRAVVVNPGPATRSPVPVVRAARGARRSPSCA